MINFYMMSLKDVCIMSVRDNHNHHLYMNTPSVHVLSQQAQAMDRNRVPGHRHGERQHSSAQPASVCPG